MIFVKFIDAFFSQKIFKDTAIRRCYRYYRYHRGKCQAFINRFLGTNIPKKNRWYHTRRMRYAYIHYKWWFDEYFLYDFNHLSKSGRRSFVPDIEKDEFCDRYKNESWSILSDKTLFYQYFRQWYGREVCVVKSWDSDYEKLCQFIQKHPDCILKDPKASCGRGVEILHHPEIRFLRDIYTKYKNGMLLEELIVQHKAMSALHPQSVNTLRVFSFYKDGGGTLFHPFIRMGRGESFVDNGGQGGIIAEVDMSTGIVFQAFDEMGQQYIVHPDTGVQIVGFKIPQWDEALSMVRELVKVFPQNAYTGWDLALTEKGWVMVECNKRAQFIGFQIMRKYGFREELSKIEDNH